MEPVVFGIFHSFIQYTPRGSVPDARKQASWEAIPNSTLRRQCEKALHMHTLHAQYCTGLHATRNEMRPSHFMMFKQPSVCPARIMDHEIAIFLTVVTIGIENASKNIVTCEVALPE